MTRLILASSSPRRSQLLRGAGFAFEVVAPRPGAEPEIATDSTLQSLDPPGLVAQLARLKAMDVADQLAANVADAPLGDAGVILAADTIAECDGRVLGKPRDEADARDMLTWLSGREHRVLTGVCVIAYSAHAEQAGRLSFAEPRVEVDITTLQMAPLDTGWVEPYLASGLWRGKAGAFGFQDGLNFVQVLTGSETNVVGLPMQRVTVLLSELGCSATR
ncbi:MAG: Maf family protein [Planctomycetota bacterium]